MHTRTHTHTHTHTHKKCRLLLFFGCTNTISSVGEGNGVYDGPGYVCTARTEQAINPASTYLSQQHFSF